MGTGAKKKMMLTSEALMGSLGSVLYQASQFRHHLEVTE